MPQSYSLSERFTDFDNPRGRFSNRGFYQGFSQPNVPDGTGFINRQYPENSDDEIANLGAAAANESASTETRFRSHTNALGSISNRAGVEQEAERRRGLAAASRDTAEGIFERQTRGMDLSARQKKAASRKLGLTRAIAEDSAGASARRGATDDAELARQAAGSLEDVALSQRLAGLSGLANAEGQRRVRAAQEDAASTASRNSLIGTVLGTAATLLI